MRKPVARRTPRAASRGVTVAAARTMILALDGIEQGMSYGMPSFKLNGRFFARFRDDDTVLVLVLGAIVEREMLMQLEPKAFFFTEHYRNYPAVLVRLAEVPRALLADVLNTSWQGQGARKKRKR